MKAQISIFYIFLAGFIFTYISTPMSMSRTYFFWSILAVAFCIIIFFVLPDKDKILKGRVLKHSNLLIFSLIIINFQYPIDYLLGYSLPSNTYIWVSGAAASKSIILSSIGLISLLIGYLLFSSSAKKIIFKKIKEPIYSLGFLKLSALVSIVVYFININPLYLTGGYAFGVEMGSIAKYVSLLFTAIIITIITQASRNLISKDNKMNKITALVYLQEIGYITLFLIVIYLLSVILSGDRGPIIIFVLVLLGGYLNVSKKRISLFTIVSIFLIASFTFSILGVARSFDSDLSFREKIEIAYFESNDESRTSISPTTKELAASIKTLHEVVEFVPEKHNYAFGRFQLHDIIIAIPFASGFYFSSWSEQEIGRYADLANFITWIAQGDNPSYGNGSSLLADFYVAGGLLGIILGMLLLGWLIRRSEYVMYSDNLTPMFWHVLSIVYFSNAIYLGRTSFLFSLKMVFMVMILIHVNKYLSFKKCK